MQQPPKTVKIAKDPNGQLKTNLFPMIRPAGTFAQDQVVTIEFQGCAAFTAQVVEEFEPMSLEEVPQFIWMICSGNPNTEPSRKAYRSYFKEVEKFTVYLFQRL